MSGDPQSRKAASRLARAGLLARGSASPAPSRAVRRSGIVPKTPRSQWRDRGGFSPPSLFCTDGVKPPVPPEQRVLVAVNERVPKDTRSSHDAPARAHRRLPLEFVRAVPPSAMLNLGPPAQSSLRALRATPYPVA
jgi:hypothetical protein